MFPRCPKRLVKFFVNQRALMQVPGSDNAGPTSDILGLELMSEGTETLLEEKKANGTM